MPPIRRLFAWLLVGISTIFLGYHLLWHMWLSKKTTTSTIQTTKKQYVPGWAEYKKLERLLLERDKPIQDPAVDAVPGNDTTRSYQIGHLAIHQVSTGGTQERRKISRAPGSGGPSVVFQSLVNMFVGRASAADAGANVSASKGLCSAPPDGNTDLHVNLEDEPKEKDLIAMYKNLKKGGHFHPENCVVDEKVAVIIPFRTRELHLLFFLKYMHRFLQRQRLRYTIYVVDQNEGSPFNRAMLMNVGFVEALRDDDFTCFVFHDVDHIPVDELLSYRCAEQPVHMAAMIDKWQWGMPYPQFAGGVMMQSTKNTLIMNGFSNNYWGWGGEDDDITQRWYLAGLRVRRPFGGHGRYATVRKNHSRSSDPNPNRMNLLKQSRLRAPYDGLNTLHYHVEEKHRHPLYTRVKVVLKRLGLR